MTKNRTLRLPEDLDEALRVEAARLDVSVHEYVLRCLRSRPAATGITRDVPGTHQVDTNETPSGPSRLRLNQSAEPLPGVVSQAELAATKAPLDANETPEQRTATADGPGVPDFGPLPTDEQRAAALKADVGLPLSEKDKTVLGELGAEAFPPDKATASKLPCNCGFRKGKDKRHNKWCPARE